MDARRPPFLDGHIEPDAHRFTVASLGLLKAEWITNGVLRGPSVRCRYITKIECGHDFITHRYARYRVELDMHVPELVHLDLRLEHFDRDSRRDPDLVDFWIDEEVVEAWNEHVLEGDRLSIRDGHCTFVGHVQATDLARMRGLVAIMSALASIPARRARELREALVRFELRTTPERLALGGEPIVLHDDVHVGVRRSDLRTYVQAENAGVQFRRTADAPGWAKQAIATLAPCTAYATNHVLVELSGWVVDGARLGTAIGLVRRLAKHTDMPYR